MNIALYSTNGSHDYEFYAPIVAAAWRKFGWEPVVVVQNISAVVQAQLDVLNVRTIGLDSVNECPDITAVQACRLYAMSELDDADYVVTSDVDMIPLSDFLPKDGANRTLGWDLNGYPKPQANIPICYVAATVREWKNVMKPEGESWQDAMVAGLREVDGLSGNWEADQDLLTNRVKAYGADQFDIVPRYTHRGTRRVCRSAWNVRGLGVGTHIDCHALRPGYGEHWSATEYLLRQVNLYELWMDDYAAAYRKSQGVNLTSVRMPDCPDAVFFKGVDSLRGWNSFMIPLYVALLNTNGKIVELGSGKSTAKLREFADAHGRVFETFDSDAGWSAKTGSTHVTDWDSVDLKCDVLFVDHAPGERRKVDLARARGVATVVVAHDTEPAAEHGYQMRPVIQTYKYVADYETDGAWATIMSDTVDVRDFAAR